MARKSEYKKWEEAGELENILIRVEGWARDGLTNKQIAENLDLNVKTLYDYQNKYSKFRNALKSGKEIIDRQVENALLKKALGYTERIQKTRVLKDGEVVTYYEDKYFAPDTGAEIFWLKNRKSDVWRDKQDLSIDGKLDIPTTINIVDAKDKDG